MTGNFFGAGFLSGGFFGPFPIGAPTAGGSGVGEWTIQLPRIPKKQIPVFKRNMENRDRADIDEILAIIDKAGLM